MMQGSSQALCSSRLSGMDAALGLCSSSLLHSRPAGLYLAHPRADHPAGKQLVGLVPIRAGSCAVAEPFSGTQVVWRLLHFSSPEAKGRTPRKGREGKGQRWKEGICRKIFPQLHLPSPPGDGRVTDRSCSLQKNFRRFPGIPKHGGLGGPAVAGALLKKTNLAQPAANSVPKPSCECNWCPGLAFLRAVYHTVEEDRGLFPFVLSLLCIFHAVSLFKQC